jgi:UDP:flavonoid glycosyltransferase YjiC (YdhE family)
MIARPRYNARTAIRELGAIMGNPSYANRAAEVGELVKQENGAKAAVDAIEEVLMD